LYKFLRNKNLGILEKIITEDDIKRIIEQRNKLFHASQKFCKGLLYDKLFPLTQELLVNDMFERDVELP